MVAHKVVSKAEGRVRRLDDVTAGERAEAIAAAAPGGKDPRSVQVVLDEAAEVLRAERGVVICVTRHGFVCANAGVDASNAADPGELILLPHDPDASARALRAGIERARGVHPAVVVSDSFGRAWRMGQTDVAIGAAGLAVIDDWRGRPDRAGRELRATAIAAADAVAGAADLARAKDSYQPAVLVRGLGHLVTREDGPGRGAAAPRARGRPVPVSGLGIAFEQTEVDGVPCFWADAPGPLGVGLLFRVGRADELLSVSGITQLVQRLALSGLGTQRYDYDARADSATAAFYATGEPDDVLWFVAHLCRTLHDLPLDRLDSEKRVLAIEDEREERGLPARLLMMRYGAAGYGLPFYEALGLRRLRAEDVTGWAARWFTGDNAALWMTRPPPPGLRLPLPGGTRVTPPVPQVVPGLRLPAFAAAGTGVVASGMVAPRSAAIAYAGRTAADRLRARIEADVDTWQLPLTAGLSHRSLSVACEDDSAAEMVSAIDEVYDELASGGPTREELELARDDALAALAADEAVPGGLDRMAVDELLGAPRAWKEDRAREAEAVSYAEVAAALREALATQLLLAPAVVPGPDARRGDYPWFSATRVTGTELRPAGRGQAAVRLIAGEDGVSHVSKETGHASTVRFAELAAAVQEADGSLTLIGRDGAIVPVDPATFRDAGKVVANLEQNLPPELIVPPREGSGLEALARRKLRPGAPVGHLLRLLGQRLDHDEEVVTMCTAIMGFKGGLLALTDRRVIWIHQGPRDPLVRELPYGHVLGVSHSRVPSHIVTLRSPVGETAFSRIEPKERAGEFVDEIRKRVAAAAAAPPPQ